VAGVGLDSGDVLAADAVVSNADVAATLAGLLPPAYRRRDRLRRRPPYSYSMSCFLLYLGLDRQYPELAHHTVLMPRDFRRAVGTIFRGGLDQDDLAVYLHTPTRTDPALAPPGGESMYALVPVPNLAGTLDWADAGAALRDRTIALLRDGLGLHDIERHIVVERRFTPIDFRDDLRSHLGAAFSIEPTLWQSAYFRPHNRQSTVPGLYLVGAGTHPGAGIPGVLLSAEITAGLVTSDLAAAG
jgi:phytoene desaturase